jgi:hypothetical protein
MCESEVKEIDKIFNNLQTMGALAPLPEWLPAAQVSSKMDWFV